jgi:two-component system sensor histidine kinase CiaH
MFTRMRYRLTLFYTTLTALSLLGFIFLFYFGLSTLLLGEEEQGALTLAKQQGLIFREKFEKRDHKPPSEKSKSPLTITNNTNDFYYVLTPKGNFIASNEPVPELRSEILSRANTWQIEKSATMNFPLTNGQELQLVIAKTFIYDDHEVVGIVIVGKDLGEYNHFLTRLSQALLGALFIFILIAALAGHVAAGRALIPIKKSFATQRQFVGDASHELRTPLSVIQASLDVLDKEDGQHISPLSRQILDDAKDEVRRMTRLISDLLTLARADSGAAEIFYEHMDIRPIAQLALRSLQHMATEKNITLLSSLPPTLFINGDKDRLAQLLFLLLDNGIKYTPPGGTVSLCIEASQHKKRQGVTILVKDNGIGMSEKDLSFIWERFYRVEKSRSREAEGFGLGLSIATWIIAAHQGTVDVISHLGTGSTFTIFIPLSPKKENKAH